MSATPRPWVAKDKGRLIVDRSTWPKPRLIAECAFDAPAVDAPPLVEAWDNRDLIVRAVNAFDALLAVAKAAADVLEAYDHFGAQRSQLAAEHGDRFDTGFVTGIHHMRIGAFGPLLHDLDQRYPDWRTWTP